MIDKTESDMYNEDEELPEGGKVYGKGTVLFSRGRMGIPAENQRKMVPVAIEEYRMLKRVAKEVGCTQDIVDKYELKITKEED